MLRNGLSQLSVVLAIGMLASSFVAAPRLAQADGRAALPASAGGFKIHGAVQTFNPGTLDNHIDGQAESVKRYQFKQCTYAEYAPNGQGNQLITVDIFEMGSPLDSYGYYSFQLSPSAKTAKVIKIGGEGNVTRDNLSFWKGPYYVVVTITASPAPANFQTAMPQIAQAIAAKLPGATQPPAMLKLLPPGRLPHSEKYQRENIGAQSFIKNGVTATYPSAGQQAELFIADMGSPAAAKGAFAQFQAYLTKPVNLALGAKPAALKGVGDSAVAVRTKFGGQVVTAVKGKYLVGVRKAKDPASALALVKSAVAKI